MEIVFIDTPYVTLEYWGTEENTQFKVIYLRSYGGRVDFSLLEGYPNPGFSPRIFTVEGHIDESISCFLSDNLLQMRIYDNRKIKDLSFLEKAPHLQKLDLGNLPGITTLPLLRLPQLSALADNKNGR